MKPDEAPAELPSGTTVPEGFTLKRTRGRPRAFARDVAVLLARHRKFEELGTLALADAWVLKHWEHRGLTETKHVRDRRDVALAGLPQQHLLVLVQGLTCLIEAKRSREQWVTRVEADKTSGSPRVADSVGMSVVAGGVCWLWRDEMYEAVEARASARATAPPTALNSIVRTFGR